MYPFCLAISAARAALPPIKQLNTKGKSLLGFEIPYFSLNVSSSTVLKTLSKLSTVKTKLYKEASHF